MADHEHIWVNVDDKTRLQRCAVCGVTGGQMGLRDALRFLRLMRKARRDFPG